MRIDAQEYNCIKIDHDTIEIFSFHDYREVQEFVEHDFQMERDAIDDYELKDDDWDQDFDKAKLFNGHHVIRWSVCTKEELEERLLAGVIWHK